QADQLGRVDPDPHGLLGTPQPGLADAGDATDLVDDVARDIVAQLHVAPAAVGRVQAYHHQEVADGLVDLHALLLDGSRQPRLNPLDAVLHVHHRQLRVGAGLEIGGDAGHAIGLALRLNVDQSLGAVEFLLDQAGDALVEDLGG